MSQYITFFYAEVRQATVNFGSKRLKTYFCMGFMTVCQRVFFVAFRNLLKFRPKVSEILIAIWLQE